MGELTCYFHKDRTAVSECETCGKYICLECQFDSNESSYSNTRTIHSKICPYCYADNIENDGTMFGMMFGCIGFMLVLVIAGAGFSSMNNDPFSPSPSTGFGGFVVLVGIIIFTMVGIVIYLSLKKGKEPNKEAVEIRAKAKKAIEESEKNLKSTEDKERAPHVALYCRFCGAPIQENDTLCNYCGMQWKWK